MRGEQPELFLVVSYDYDEQQAFWDIVAAYSADEARNMIGAVRGNYADVVDVLSRGALAHTHHAVLTSTVEKAEREYQEMLAGEWGRDIEWGGEA